MKLTVYTERGTFVSKTESATAAEVEQVQEIIECAANGGSYFKLDTETGYVVIGKELLRTAVFVVDA